MRAANTSFFGTKGFTGLYAPGVEFAGPVNLGEIDAHDDATPVLAIGSVAEVRIAGGSLTQTNAKPVRVGGAMQIRFADGSDSHGRLVPKKTNAAGFEKDGADAAGLITILP